MGKDYVAKLISKISNVIKKQLEDHFQEQREKIKQALEF